MSCLPSGFLSAPTKARTTSTLGVGDLDGRILGALGVAGLLAPGEVGAGIGQRGADGAGGGADVTARAGGQAPGR
jgi:hypothetical protein